MDSKRQSVARSESRRYETNMVYLVSFLFATKKETGANQPKSLVRTATNATQFTNLIGDYLVILSWLLLICAALPAGRVTVIGLILRDTCLTRCSSQEA